MLQVVAGLLVACALLGYGLHLFSPLRLNSDALAYLMRAAGGSLADDAPVRSYPEGYIGMLRGLVVIGAGSSTGIVALNLVALAAGIGAAWALYRRAFHMRRQAALIGCLLLVYAYVVVKHVVLPLPDVLFGALTWATLLALLNAEEHRCWRWLFLAAGGWACGLMIRSAGIVLLVPLFVAGWLMLKPLMHRHSMHALLIGIPIVAAVGSGLVYGHGTILLYVEELKRNYASGGVYSMFWWNVRTRAKEAAELLFNVPRAKVLEMLPLTSEVYVVPGFLILSLIIFGGWMHRHRSRVLSAYALTSLVLLLAWPARDVRLWLPLLPLVVGYLWTTIRGMPHHKLLLGGVLTSFSITGLVALAYSSWITLSGPHFPERYGGGYFGRAFEAYCNHVPILDDRGQERARRVLMYYEGPQPAASAVCTADPAVPLRSPVYVLPPSYPGPPYEQEVEHRDQQAERDLR